MGVTATPACELRVYCGCTAAPVAEVEGNCLLMPQGMPWGYAIRPTNSLLMPWGSPSLLNRAIRDDDSGISTAASNHTFITILLLLMIAAAAAAGVLLMAPG